MLKRYAVLNNRAFLIYKDDMAFRAYPQKPTIVIPLAEVVSASLRVNPIAIRAQTGARAYESMYILEMTLSRNYSTISKNIFNFHSAQDMMGGRLDLR